MARTKHQKTLIVIALLSSVIQLDHIVLSHFRLISSETLGTLFAVLCLLYIAVVIYLIYIIGNYGKTLFKKHTASTVISILFSLPLIYIGIFIYSEYFKKTYSVSVFTANGKTYKEIKWFYNSGELYTVEYWSTEDKSPLTDPIKIKDSVFIDEDEIREFGHFASEHETGDDMVRDSIWLKLEKNGDTIEHYEFTHKITLPRRTKD